MKTKAQNPKSGTPSRSEQLGTEQKQQQQPKPAKPYVNLEERNINRKLSTDQVLEMLCSHMPEQYGLAEIVGKWVCALGLTNCHSDETPLVRKAQ